MPFSRVIGDNVGVEIPRQERNADDIEHFLKVSHSYWPGLFHCYDIQGLPRTNNDLEHVFGKWRHHKRRCTGQKVAPASLVVRGSVQLAAVATQLRSFTALELASVSVEAWQQVRANLNQQSSQTSTTTAISSETDYLSSISGAENFPASFAALEKNGLPSPASLGLGGLIVKGFNF